MTPFAVTGVSTVSACSTGSFGSSSRASARSPTQSGIAVEVPRGVRSRRAWRPSGTSREAVTSIVTTLFRARSEMGAPVSSGRRTGTSGPKSAMLAIRAVSPGSLNNTASASPRFVPSTVIVVVVPRWTPYGAALAMIGGRVCARTAPAPATSITSAAPAVNLVMWIPCERGREVSFVISAVSWVSMWSSGTPRRAN